MYFAGSAKILCMALERLTQHITKFVLVPTPTTDVRRYAYIHRQICFSAIAARIQSAENDNAVASMYLARQNR